MSGRKAPAHPAPIVEGNRSVLLFVTVCSAQRKSILASEAAARVIVDAWVSSTHWLVGRYIILPDHLHLFCSPARADALPLKNWLAFWKSAASRRWPMAKQHPIWQADGWDTQLRAGDSYHAKWEYVRHNAVRHGLVSHPADWPWQGELNALNWHDR